jgi:hypothetical protein
MVYFSIIQYRRLFAETQPPRWVSWVTDYAAYVCMSVGFMTGYLLLPDC